MGGGRAICDRPTGYLSGCGDWWHERRAGYRGGGSVNLSEFRSYRDRFALASMLARGRKLEAQSDAALDEVRRLRKELAKYPAPPGGLQYNLTAAQFDERI